jgi:phosphoribosyl-ATP pyrophosphohydrolase
MEQDLIKIYQIESDTKLDKLTEELQEFIVEYKSYRNNPTTDNMDNLISELIDLNIVVLQLAIVKHGYRLAEIYARLRNKVNLTVSIGKLILNEGIDYKTARGRLR